jgi:hypothetical protein
MRIEHQTLHAYENRFYAGIQSQCIEHGGCRLQLLSSLLRSDEPRTPLIIPAHGNKR